MAATVRYVPERELPPYTYVPGRAPHPLNDPRGHSFAAGSGAVESRRSPMPHDPASSAEFRWGVDLFNHGYYWEAHEAWEGVWIAAGRRGPIAEFVQGLIKLAAAGVKAREGTPGGVRRHVARARQLIEGARRGESDADLAALGLRLEDLETLCDEMAAAGTRSFPTDSVPRAVINQHLELPPPR